MKFCVRMLSVFGVLAALAVGQHAGDSPPALVWDKLKGNCPASLDWASLRGSAVVISVGSDDVFPEEVTEWTEVLQKFRGEPVLFFQVVTGSEFLLDQALRTTAYAGCVLLDRDQANRDDFQLPRSRRTVVVNQQGVIAGYSFDPDEHSIRAVLDRKIETGLAAVPPQPKPYDPVERATPLPSYEVQISPATSGAPRALDQGWPDRYISLNESIKVIISDLWHTPMPRISFPATFDERSYDITSHIPLADGDLLRRLVREAVEGHFGLRIEKELRTEHVYLMKATKESSSQLQPAREDDDDMSGGGQGSIIGTAQTMQNVASAFEGLLNTPVMDETGLKGKYNYSASSALRQPDAALEMAHQLGLELIPADRPIEMLIVRKLN